MLPWLSLVSLILLSLALTGWDDLHSDFTALRNKKHLARVAAQTKQFVTHHNRTPYNAMELRSFIKSRGHKAMSLYDSRGNRLQYIRFSQFNYLLRALGSDEIEDNIKGRDDSVFAKIPIPKPVKVRYEDDGAPHYPHLNLLGSRFGTLVAWIAVDRERKQKKLVLRCQDNPKLIMTAPHKLVDEFLWIEGTEAIVYTTSDREDTGLYLWYYDTGNVVSLSSEGFISQTNDIGEQSRTYIALKNYSPQKRQLRYYQLASSTNALDPARFFAKSHEKVIEFSKDFSSFSPIVQMAAFRPRLDDEPAHPLNEGFTVLAKNRRPEVLMWQQIKVEGTVNDILESWQRYSLAHTASPLYPYSLWSLGTIYNQAFHLYQQHQQPGADQLQRFGMQISDALGKMTLAPAYLRAFANFNFQQLNAQDKPSFPLATLVPEPAEDN